MSGKTRQRIAVLDDDADLCKLLRFLFEKDYEVIIARNGTKLRTMIEEGALDLIVLDVGLPGENGIAIAQQIRMISSIPLLFLSGFSSEEMIVKGLNIGGDDYVTKPFQPEVLLARIRNALRRTQNKPLKPPLTRVAWGRIVLDVHGQRLESTDGRSVKLTEMEVQILGALATAEEQALSREDLFRRVHGRDWDTMNRALEVHVSHLRHKLAEVCELDAAPIIGVRGVGYRLNLGPRVTHYASQAAR